MVVGYGMRAKAAYIYIRGEFYDEYLALEKVCMHVRTHFRWC